MGMLNFTKAQLLEELDIVENTLRVLVEEKGFPHPRRMGGSGKLFWLVAEVLAWLQGCPRAWCGAADQDGDGSSSGSGPAVN